MHEQLLNTPKTKENFITPYDPFKSQQIGKSINPFLQAIHKCVFKLKRNMQDIYRPEREGIV